MSRYITDIYDAIRWNDFRYVFAHKDQINQKDLNECTPLMIACIFENESMANFLLNLGADATEAIKRTLCYSRPVFLEKLLKFCTNVNEPINKNIYLIDLVYVRNDYSWQWIQHNTKLFMEYRANPFTPCFRQLQKDTKKSIIKEFWMIIKRKYFPVGVALIHLSANELLAIMEALCPGAVHLNHFQKWNLITFIKHFKNTLDIGSTHRENLAYFSLHH